MKEEDCHRDGTRRHRRCHRPKNSEDPSQAGGAVREEVMEVEEAMEALQVVVLPMEEEEVLPMEEEEEFGQEFT